MFATLVARVFGLNNLLKASINNAPDDIRRCCAPVNPTKGSP
jgi:hypothetical protein